VRSFVCDGWNVLKADAAGADVVLVNGQGLDQVCARTVGSTTRSFA
jgi:coenzyme F420-reducing hydrogenase delta subunit